MDKYGKCHACVDTGVINVDNIEENCKVCPNRIRQGGYCVLRCPPDKPLMDKYGECHACDDVKNIDVQDVEEGCKACPNLILKGRVCGLPSMIKKLLGGLL